MLWAKEFCMSATLGAICYEGGNFSPMPIVC